MKINDRQAALLGLDLIITILAGVAIYFIREAFR